MSLGLGAGCVGQFGQTIDRDDPDQVQVGIMVPPEDEELHSIRIANHLAANMRRAGMSVDVIPTRRQNLLRDVLINRDFEMYVGRYPGDGNPDFLYPFFHSKFAEEPGWQNPTSYTNTVMDDLLEVQRKDPVDRNALLTQIQELLIAEVPIIPVAFERRYAAYAPQRTQVQPEIRLEDALWPVSFQAADDTSSTEETVLGLGSIDARATRNLNPLSVDFRGIEDLTDLLYEPLLRWDGDRYLPWLAASWEWTSPVEATAPTLELQLREELSWHDSVPITAEDIAFTLRLLKDTTMTTGDPTIPAPRFRGRSSLIDTVDTVDSYTARIQFVDTSRRIARRALTVPILPKHVWADRTGLTEIGGIELSVQTTDAVIHENIPPIGSGPYRFAEVDTDRELVLDRFADHFLPETDPEGPLGPYRNAAAFDRVRVEFHPSRRNLVAAIREGSLDVSLSNLGRELATEIQSDPDRDLAIVSADTTWLTHVGFNLRRVPFTIAGFRQALHGLLDREYVIQEVFAGGATPTLSPLADEAVVPSHLRWPGIDDTPFAGEPGSGEVDPATAKSRFRDAGFQYTTEGELLIQN